MNKKDINIGDIVLFKNIQRIDYENNEWTRGHGKVLGIYGDKYSIVGYDINTKKEGPESHWFYTDEFDLI